MPRRNVNIAELEKVAGFKILKKLTFGFIIKEDDTKQVYWINPRFDEKKLLTI